MFIGFIPLYVNTGLPILSTFKKRYQRTEASRSFISYGNISVILSIEEVTKILKEGILAALSFRQQVSVQYSIFFAEYF